MDHLLSNPLGNQVVAKDDDGGAGNEPQCVETEKRVIEATLQKEMRLFCFALKKIYHLLWIVLECEECGVDEHQPADHPHDHQPVTKHRVIEVEHLGWFSLGCVVITTGLSLFWTFAILLSEMHLMQILRGKHQFD